MEEFYSKITEKLREGHRLVLATVIRQSGSSPRGVGSKMAIFPNGLGLGSVGGGRVEAQVMEEARRLLQSGGSRRLDFKLTGTDILDMQMICGGEMEILLEVLGKEDLEVFEGVREALQKGTPAVLLTGLPPKMKGKMLLIEGRKTGSLQGADDSFLDSLSAELPREASIIDLGYGEVFCEPIIKEPDLYLFGAGHIAQEIAPLATRVGFRVVVIDDRPEYANRERFPWADEVVVEDFERVGERVVAKADSYLVIVTRGHLHDYTVLKQYLRSPARYIGMIGSRRKRDMIYRQLLSEGFSPKDLERVHAPIGIDIGAETPQEIAVSIVAELIKVRRLGP